MFMEPCLAAVSAAVLLALFFHPPAKKIQPGTARRTAPAH
jgi:hypothetical protein